MLKVSDVNMISPHFNDCEKVSDVNMMGPHLNNCDKSFRCEHDCGNEGSFRPSPPCDICPGLEKTEDIQANKSEMCPAEMK